MKTIKQSKIAKMANLSRSFLSLIIAGKRRPSYSTAKRLAKVTGTDPVLWLEGKPEEIRDELNNNKQDGD